MHAAAFSEELLYDVAGNQPGEAVLDFWRPFADCLTDLDIDAERVNPQLRLQPQLLSQLTALTHLTFITHDGLGPEDHLLRFPELRSLEIHAAYGDRVIVECPRLTYLHCGSRLCLPAPLPDLVSLCVRWNDDGDDSNEEALFSALPLMSKLRTLDLVVDRGWLLRSLLQSLCEVALDYLSGEGWDGRVIPALQQLPELKDLKIKIKWRSGDTPAMLSSDLRPFMAMQKLCSLELGPREAWTPCSLIALVY